METLQGMDWWLIQDPDIRCVWGIAGGVWMEQLKKMLMFLFWGECLINLKLGILKGLKV